MTKAIKMDFDNKIVNFPPILMAKSIHIKQKSTESISMRLHAFSDHDDDDDDDDGDEDNDNATILLSLVPGQLWLRSECSENLRSSEKTGK